MKKYRVKTRGLYQGMWSSVTWVVEASNPDQAKKMVEKMTSKTIPHIVLSAQEVKDGQVSTKA